MSKKHTIIEVSITDALDGEPVRIPFPELTVMDRDGSVELALHRGGPRFDASKGFRVGLKNARPQEQLDHIYLFADGTGGADDVIRLLVGEGIFAVPGGDIFSGDVAQTPPVVLLDRAGDPNISGGYAEILVLQDITSGERWTYELSGIQGATDYAAEVRLIDPDVGVTHLAFIDPPGAEPSTLFSSRSGLLAVRLLEEGGTFSSIRQTITALFNSDNTTEELEEADVPDLVDGGSGRPAEVSVSADVVSTEIRDQGLNFGHVRPVQRMVCGSNGTSTWTIDDISAMLPVVPGDVVRGSLLMDNDVGGASTTNTILRVVWFDAAGSQLSTDDLDNHGSGNVQGYMDGTATAPASAAFASLETEIVLGAVGDVTIEFGNLFMFNEGQ